MKAGIASLKPSTSFFQPAMFEDPYPIYSVFRKTDPVHWDEGLEAWVLTRYEDVAFVLNDHRFSSDRIAVGRKLHPMPEFEPLFDHLSHLMLQHDEPTHKHLRAIVHDAFTRSAMKRWESVIQYRVDDLLEIAVDLGKMEFLVDFAIPLPVMVISELVGIPIEDRTQVKAWCDDFAFVATNFYAEITDEQLQRGLQSVDAFRKYLRHQAERIAPGADMTLLELMVQSQGTDAEFSYDELIANCMLLLTAGNETTTNLLGNGLIALLENRDQLSRLNKDPSLIPSAVEECLRYDSPLQFVGRIALEEVAIGSRTIRPGDLVLVMLGSANRDPERFPSPDEFDIARPNNHHLAFGHGPHFCVGSQLSRMEATIAFRTLLPHMESMKVKTQDLRHQQNYNLRCFQNIPLKFSQSPTQASF
ncbi:Biotin biosynthesis cytochrome P450 [Thalassoglobus neptunius]|uniref:Biotin biosynthesis cytochrome P450 n=1 Tax=Thalassoglobus neptunius TaxID=1938619 RepID=A0A5C5WCP9_9PLAN|nr:cytochrome P450 [Thalassoglobus neptunius]TWT47893.1 Biotin biosynthesis cytochrome P450 [Thalassoglobus neptunius]